MCNSFIALLTLSYLGKAISENPGYLKLRKIRAAQAIASTVGYIIDVVMLLHLFCSQISNSQNRVYLNAETLMLNLDNMELKGA